MLEVARKLRPDALAKLRTPHELLAVRFLRLERVCEGGRCSRARLCKPCLRLHRLAVKQYHEGIHDRVELMTTEAALDEIAMRLAFEVAFGILTPDHIASGYWMAPRLRDRGHGIRMRLLSHKIRYEDWERGRFAWLVRPRFSQ